MYKQCVSKSGVIDIIIHRPLPGSHLIKTTPVLMIITKEDLTVFKDLRQKNVIQKINLDNIQRVDQHYLNTLCFDIIVTQIENKILKKGPLSFCVDTKEKFNVWLGAILEFKQCRISINTNIGNKVLVDFKNVNTVKKRMKAERENVMSDLFYDGEDRFYKNTKMNEKTDENIKNAIDLIKKSIKRGNLAKRLIRRQYSGKMRNSHSFSQTFMKKQTFFKRKIENRIANEREREFSALRHIHKPKELDLLMKTVKNINEVNLRYTVL